MKSQFSLFGLLVMSFLFVQCEHTAIGPSQRVFRELTTLEKSLVESDNRFALKLFREVAREKKNENVFISPLSVAMALGMTLNGANAGTREAMESALELSGLTIEEINESYQSLLALLVQLDPKVQMQIANAIWYRQEMTLEPDFVALNQKYFDAVVRGLNFNDAHAKDIINAWVKEKTRGRIPTIVDQINRDHMMFLINAIYFKGAWTYKFNPNQTRDDWFTTASGAKTACKMMNLKNDWHYFTNDQFQAIDLPYGDAGFSMTVLLPQPGIAVDSVVAAFTSENWAAWQNQLAKQTVELALPKFSLSFEMSLKETLQALGMAVAFTPAADFTKMSRAGNLAISDVKHKTFVEVNEEGTEAAAVTSVGIIVTSLPQTITMRVDRPFVYVLREHNSQTILFMGRMLEVR